MSSIAWNIELFGSLRGTLGSHVVKHFRTQKTGLLLAHLALFPQRPHRREELIDLLWPDNELDSGRNCLRIALNALRQQFQSESEVPAIILADRQYVQLNPEAVKIDKSEFEACLARAHRAPGDEERTILLKQAVAMYHGGLLIDYDAVWFESERKRLADAHLLALRRLIKLLIKSRALDEALHYAQSAVASDPVREESHRMLMQLHGALRSPGAALRQYQELTRVLEDQLGSAPSAATKSLLAQITNGPAVTVDNGGVVATLTGSASIPPSSLPSSSPAPPPFAPGILPIPRTRFFGREDCLAQVLEMFDTPETRLITITGMGGSGKTRLALAVAERLHADYNGAVWFVPLASLQTADRLPEAVLQALAVRNDGAGTALDQIVSALSGRAAVLVLDNFEHIADEGASVIHQLLDRLPMLACLVTSRQRLNVAGEYEYAVLPLATPHSPGTPERLQEFASVQLFVDRAQLARREFQLTPANAGVVAALCHHLEGVPLSIELAAAYIQAMSPAQIYARLTPRLPLLINRQKDAAQRHSSLHATLEWSYDLLHVGVQRFFARLSVFRDGWDLEGAEVVSADPLAVEYLIQLRERSLVTVEEVGDSMRYRFLEIVREYAAEKLNADEQLDASCLHAEYFLSQAESAEGALLGPEAPSRLEALEREHPNLRAALGFTLSHEASTRPHGAAVANLTAPRLPEMAALRLAGALWRFWYMHGHYEEGGEWLNRALAAGDQPTPEYMRAWRGLGNLAYDCGQLDRAHAAFTRLLSLAQEAERRPDEAAALGSLGNVALAKGDIAQARCLLQESLMLFRLSSDTRGTALVLANLALVTLDTGDAHGACSLHKESLALFEKTNDTHNIALAHNNIGHTAMQAGMYVTAQQHLLSSLALARVLGSPFLELYAIANLTCLMSRQQRWRNAALLCGVTDSHLREHRASLLPKAEEYFREERNSIEAYLGPEEFLTISQQGANMRVDQLEALVSEANAPAFA